MNSLKRSQIFFVIVLSLLCICVFFSVCFLARPAYAEKEPYYTSDDEFLPLGTIVEEEEDEKEKAFLENDSLIKNGIIKGLKLLKEENKLALTTLVP